MKFGSPGTASPEDFSLVRGGIALGLSAIVALAMAVLSPHPEAPVLASQSPPSVQPAQDL